MKKLRRIFLFIAYLVVAIIVYALEGLMASDGKTPVGIVIFILASLAWYAYLYGILRRIGRPTYLALGAFVPPVSIPLVFVALWWVSGERLGLVQRSESHAGQLGG